MKINISSTNVRRKGSALIIVMVLGTLMLLSLAGYLTMVNHQNYMSVRSQAWNMSIAVVEAGIEEAMEHLNANTNNLGTEGWGFDGQSYVLDYDMGNGMGYSVSIDTTTDPNSPSIVSEGFSTLDGGPIVPIFGAIGVDGAPKATLTRAVKVHANRSSMFIKAMVAKRRIEMNGNNIMTDSYDSADLNKSTGGRYDVWKAGSKGDVAVNASIHNAINVGNANIYGHASTGPRGTIALGPKGGVGEQSWVLANPGQIQPDWFKDDMNFTFPDPTLPSYDNALTPLPGQIVSVSTTVTPVEHSGTPEPGVDGVATNITYTFTSTYPGATDGLTTNLVWHNTTTPPASSDVSGDITTNMVQQSNREWPGTGVGTITTNTIWNISKVYPSGVTGVETNYTFVTGSSLPSPLPSGPIRTNTTIAKTKSYPVPGTYIGTPYKYIGWWYCHLITGYTWRVVEYRWPVLEYVWAEPHYIYQTVSYGIPSVSYSWTGYQTNYFYTTNTYDHVLDSGNYVVSTLSGTTYVKGDATLVVLDDIRMSGNDQLTVGPNGKVHMFVDGNDTAISGNGILNMNGQPMNCIIEFTKSVQKVAFSGNGEFIGVLVAPFSVLEMDGGGSAMTDFCGAVIADIIELRGQYKFHYDEALGRLPHTGRYLVTSWDEIKADTAFASYNSTSE